MTFAMTTTKIADAQLIDTSVYRKLCIHRLLAVAETLSHILYIYIHVYSYSE